MRIFPEKSKCPACLAAAALFFILAFPLMAASPPQADEGFYFSFKYLNLSINGDLDGKTVVGNSEKAFFIPMLKDGNGYTVSIGHKWKRSLWEVFFMRTTHETTFQDDPGHAAYSAFGMDGKIFLLSNFPIRPYVLIGFNIPWLTVKNGAILNKTIKNAAYIGVCLDAGAGLLIHLNSKLFLSGGMIYRVIGMLSTLSPGKPRDFLDLFYDRTGSRLTNYFWSRGLTFEVGVGFTL